MPRPLQLHVVFKSHLDVGFTDLAANVVEDYLHFFIPRAIAVSRRLRELGRPERFIWTTGSWLIHHYLETRSAPERANLERALVDGDITWHGLPFTMHCELMDASLFEEGLSISRELDSRFGKKTIAAKMTDVPGHTRAIVPLLAGAGIRFLHIGINGACSAPEVPPLFKWRDEASGAEIIVMQHSNYGGVHIDDDLGLLLECALDNEPSASVQSIVPFYRRLRKQYPQAEIFGSTLDAYAARLLERAPSLPVVTAEIGDSWIKGGASDPKKIAQFRDLLRLHRKWAFSASKDSVRPFARKLLMVPEHTWGLDSIMYMADETSYRPEHFFPALKSGRFATFEASWTEQRNYIEQAIAVLPADKASEAREVLHRKDSWPGPESFQAVNAKDLFETPLFTLGIDPVSGAICHLKSGDHVWADATHRLFEFSYQLYSQTDYEHYLDSYVLSSMRNEWWVPAAFARTDLTQLQPAGGLWTARFKELLHLRSSKGDYFEIRLTAAADVPTGCGFPDSPCLRLFFPQGERSVQAEFGWSGKTACRYPEALWLHLNPRVSDSTAWRLDKLGSRISPFDVVKKAGQHLHAVGADITCATGDARVVVRPLDSPLVCLGKRSLLCAGIQDTSAADGLYFNLHNNTWGTNFPLWFGEPASFRFSLEFSCRGQQR